MSSLSVFLAPLMRNWRFLIFARPKAYQNLRCARIEVA
ncbi:hypothetical protein NIES2104_65480 [Leptolyngbya sp. NIES-2104]|nr:hypothetical protein NIES2104_65480 [Leptolyngbya sp. NIES-2104]